MLLDFFVSSKVLFVNQTLLFLIMIILLFLNYKKIYLFFKEFLNRNDLIFIFFLFLFSLLFRLFYFGNFHYSNDEYMYIESARELYNFQQLDGYTRVIGWPYLLFLVFSVFGFYSLVGFIFSIILGSLSVSLLYIIFRFLFEDRKISIFGSLLFSILPFHVFWSNNLETSIASLFFIFITVIFYFIFNRTKDFSFFYISIFLTVFTTTIRPENTFIYIYLLLILLFNIKIFLRNINSIFISFFLFFLGLFLSFSNYINQYLFTNGQDWNYGNGGNFGTHNLNSNVSYFINGFFDNKLFSFYNYFFYIGVAYFIYYLYLIFLKKRDYLRSFNLFIFISVFFGLTIVYNFIRLRYIYGVDRLYLMVYPLYFLFFGLGVYLISNLFSIKFKKYEKYITFFFIFLVISNIFSLGSYSFNSPHHELQMALSNDFKNIKDDNCLYIIYDTYYYSGYVKSFNYTHIYEFNSNTFFQEQIFNNFSCIVFIDDKFCNDSSRGNKFRGPDGTQTTLYCDKLKSNFDLYPIKTYSLDGLRYGYYKIIKK